MFSVKPEKACRFCGKRDGFAYLELMVAAVLVVVLVIAVVSGIRKSTDIQLEDYHRRQARAAIMQQFESSFVHLITGTNYNVVVEHLTVVGGEDDDKDDLTVKKTPLSVPVTGSFVGDMEFILDDRGVSSYTEALTGRISFRVAVGSQTVTLGTPQTMPTHDVTIRVTWREVGKTTDETLELTKRLAHI